jgi:hypothetical protein
VNLSLSLWVFLFLIHLSVKEFVSGKYQEIRLTVWPDHSQQYSTCGVYNGICLKKLHRKYAISPQIRSVRLQLVEGNNPVDKASDHDPMPLTWIGALLSALVTKVVETERRVRYTYQTQPPNEILSILSITFQGWTLL